MFKEQNLVGKFSGQKLGLEAGKTSIKMEKKGQAQRISGVFHLLVALTYAILPSYIALALGTQKYPVYYQL